MSVCACMYLSIHLSIYRSIYLSIYLSIDSSIDRSTYLSIYLSIHLHTHVHLQICVMPCNMQSLYMYIHRQGGREKRQREREEIRQINIQRETEIGLQNGTFAVGNYPLNTQIVSETSDVQASPSPAPTQASKREVAASSHPTDHTPLYTLEYVRLSLR